MKSFEESHNVEYLQKILNHVLRFYKIEDKIESYIYIYFFFFLSFFDFSFFFYIFFMFFFNFITNKTIANFFL